MPFPGEQLLDVVMYTNLIEKQTDGETCTYTVICAKDQSFNASYVWETVAQQLEAFDFVQSVERNPFSADDALLVLQKVVGKIDKFPCEE